MKNEASEPNLSDKAAGFVSLQQAFHPEAAAVTATTADDQNKWGVVWAEATLISESETEQQQQENDPINKEDQQEESAADGLASPVVQPSAPPPSSPSSSSAPYHNGCFLDICLGLCLTVSAVGAVWSMELAAALVYVLAVGFYTASHSCRKYAERCPLCWLFFGVFGLVYGLLTLMDALLLFFSVFVSEILAAIGWFLTSLCGGFKTGCEWHQYIRKLCHLTRWAFRSFHQSWDPARRFPFGCTAAVGESNDENVTEKPEEVEEETIVVAQVIST